MIPTPTKPLKFFQIWNMSFGFFGIQFGWGLQMANMSAIYQFLGAGEEDIAILWLAAPLTGLIIQPIVGFYSDRTWTGLGRRRPYFLVGAILASLALIAMPNSPSLWVAAGLLWVLDASVNISMEPFRAFVGDLLPPKQRKVGFAMQSLLIGAGAVLASLMPWFLSNVVGMSGGVPDVVLTAGDGTGRDIFLDKSIPKAVHLSFYMGAAFFISAVLYTIFTTKERPPADMEAFKKMKAESSGVMSVFKEILSGIVGMPKTMAQLAIVQFFTWFALFCMWIYFVPGVGSKVFDGEPLGDEVEHLTEGSSAETTMKAVKWAFMDAREKSGSAGEAPVSIGLDAFFEKVKNADANDLAGVELDPIEKRNPIYTTAAHLVMQEGAELEGVSRATAFGERLDKAVRFEKGVEWGGLCFMTYNFVAFFFSFILLALVQKVSAKAIHTICLLLGAVGFIGAGLISSPTLLFVPMIFIGIAWASILSMPYAMLSNAIPPAKMGFYMGVFNFFIVLPQILASLGLGFIMNSLLGGQSMNAIILGGAALVLAALMLRFVDDHGEVGAAD